MIDDRVVIITALLVLVVCLATLSQLLGRALSTATTALVRSAYKHVRHVR